MSVPTLQNIIFCSGKATRYMSYAAGTTVIIIHVGADFATFQYLFDNVRYFSRFSNKNKKGLALGPRAPTAPALGLPTPFVSS